MILHTYTTHWQHLELLQAAPAIERDGAQEEEAISKQLNVASQQNPLQCALSSCRATLAC